MCIGYGLPRWRSGKESTCQYRRCKRCRFNSWVGKIPWNRKWQPAPVFLPGKFPWTGEPGRLQSMGLKELDTTDHVCTHKLNIPLIFFNAYHSWRIIKSNIFRKQTGSIHISNDKWYLHQRMGMFVATKRLYLGEENGNPLRYSCLETPMNRGVWWATVHGVTKSWTRLSD